MTFKHFNHLNIPDSWERYFTKYPQGMSILESLFEWVSQVDNMVDNQNKLNVNVEQFRNEIDDFVGRFDERLQTEVVNTLNDWQESGFLDIVISDVLKWQLNDYISVNEQDKRSLTAQLKQLDNRVGETIANAGDGTIPTELIDMRTINEKTYVTAGNAVRALSTGEAIKEKSITEKLTSFIKVSPNLLNPDEMIDGFTTAPDGALSASLNFSVSELKKVKPNATYSTNRVIKVHRYRADGTAINSYSPTNTDNAQWTTDPNTEFVRLVTYYGFYKNGGARMNEGEVLLPYEPYGKYLNDDIILNIPKYEPVDPEEVDTMTVDKFVLGMETNEKHTQAGLTGGRQFTRGELLSMYVDLRQEFPEYLTEHVFGKDAFNNDLIYYHANPTKVPMANATTKFPKMILVSGVHGEERAGVYNLFYAIRNIAKNWRTNPLLEMLRWNVELIIVPIVNPSGYDVSSRKNGNGIDLARNFPEGFRVTNPADATYGGQEPLSEKESQFLDHLIESHSDAIYFGSFHNMWSSTSFIWNASATQLQLQLGKQIITMQTQKWKKEHNWMPQEDNFYVGYADMNSPKGSESLYAASKGIQASTFEMSASVGFNANDKGSFSDTSTNLGTETILNWLGLVLKENIKFYNSLK